MSRFLFALLLLAATVSAQAVTPSRQDANGSGGTCPETETAVAAEEETAARPATPAVAAKPAPAVPAKGGGLARPKSGERWHSFLPGMFK